MSLKSAPSQTAFLALAALLCGCSTRLSDPLPSWANGATKQQILGFTARVTDPNGPDYVRPEERIAVFDNDGTLWVEQPLYTEVVFAGDQVKTLAPQHPEWSSNPAFQQLITGPAGEIFRLSPKDQFAVVFAVHSGMSVEEYSRGARTWLADKRHPRFDRRYKELAYQPMLELIAFLRAKEFQIYSVTGEEIAFARVVNQEAFGIPPGRVIGTVLKTTFEGQENPPQLAAHPDLVALTDGDGKPVSIGNFIGRRPVAAFGNSDGDLAMLQWTASGPGSRLAAIVHHDDAVREYAYDRASAVGHLEKALDAAQQKGWTVISMKSDWTRILSEASR